MQSSGTILQQSGADSQQFLSFALGAEEYGLDILRVQEIKGYTGITPIPNSAPHVRGVMNLRGTVIPVVDLRLKFSMETQEYTRFTVIIVVTTATRTIGLVVDAVSDVLDIRAEDIRPAPDLGSSVDTRFIDGVVTSGEKLVVLLSVDRLLASDGLGSDERVTTAQTGDKEK